MEFLKKLLIYQWFAILEHSRSLDLISYVYIDITASKLKIIINKFKEIYSI